MIGIKYGRPLGQKYPQKLFQNGVTGIASPYKYRKLTLPRKLSGGFQNT